jgi:hypothetical protein
MAAAFLVFAWSPTITFNQYRLFTYPVPYPIEALWSIFRATGRMTWPVIYIAIAFSVWWILKKSVVKKATLLLCALLFVQYIDICGWFTSKGNGFKTRVEWQTELSDAAWALLADNYNHIFFMGGYLKLFSFLDYTAAYNMTVNDTYLARKNHKAINTHKQREMEYLKNNGPRDDTIYIFESKEQAVLCKRSGLYLYIVDDIVIGIHSEKDYLTGY